MPTKSTGRPRGRPPYPGLLTPAEERVLSLLREGRTNPEIAAAIGVSVDTVKYHVANMLSKTGVSDRGELAEWASEDRRRIWPLFMGALRSVRPSRRTVEGVWWLASLGAAGSLVLVAVVAIISHMGSPPGAPVAQSVAETPTAASPLRTLVPAATATPATVSSTTADEIALRDVSCVAGDWCMAVGLVGQFGPSQAIAGAWTGGSMAVNVVPGPAGAATAVLGAVSCPAIDDCMAVGFASRRYGGALAFVSRFDGVGWQQERLDPNDRAGVTLYDVSCWAPGACVAVGARASGEELAEPVVIERRRGAWIPVPLGSPAGMMRGWWESVDCRGSGECVLAGTWESRDGTKSAYLGEFTAAAGRVSLLPQPTNGDVVASAIDCSTPTGCAIVGTYESSRARVLVPMWRTNATGAWAGQTPADRAWATGVGGRCGVLGTGSVRRCRRWHRPAGPRAWGRLQVGRGRLVKVRAPEPRPRAEYQPQWYLLYDAVVVSRGWTAMGRGQARLGVQALCR